MVASIFRLALAALIAVSIAACSSATLANNKYPEVTDEGLRRAQSKRLDAVYWADGASLAPYSKIMIGDIDVAFRKNWQRDQNSLRSPVNSVDADDMNRIRAALVDSFRSVFAKELEEKGRYPVVQTEGADVLLLKPEIVNLDVFAPDVLAPVSNRTFTTTAGEMTLRMDLVDASTNALIGRVIDRQRAPDSGPNRIQFTNRLTNRVEAERMMRRWANVLRGALDDSRVAAE